MKALLRGVEKLKIGRKNNTQGRGAARVMSDLTSLSRIKVT